MRPQASRPARAALAALWLAVLAAAGACQQAGARPTPARPASVALRPADLGPGWRLAAEPTGPDPEWPWDQRGVCPRYVGNDYPAQKHRTMVSRRSFSDERGDTVWQVVEVFEPGWARRSVADVRRVLRVCDSYTVAGSQVTFTTVDPSPAGPDSLLVHGSIGAPGRASTDTYFLVLAKGEAVTTLQVPQALGEPFARRLAGLLSAQAR